MALTLRAEQKSITDLFNNGEDVYIIPEYQRPYSWSKDASYQLYMDITTAFLEDKDYFVGNIVMARGNEDKKKPNVVDGQQRLITLWLWIKALTLLHSGKTRLSRLLMVESVLSDGSTPRIISNVYEHEDQDNINTVLSYDKAAIENASLSYKNSKGDIDETKCSRIETNAIYVYKWLREFYANLKEEERQLDFLKYFLERVYLLPIELDGKDIEEASDRALTIFETINNRGQALEDSDIFKARLYKSAKAEGKEGKFIEQWLEFNEICDNLRLKVDDLFRYYYHILRGQEGQTNNEGSLREYLISGNKSALSRKSYNEVVEDLSKISSILQWLSAPNKMPVRIARQIQLIEHYSNQYPKYALVNYLFVEGLVNLEALEEFLDIIVQYFYYRGATIQVKYETYKINKFVACRTKIQPYDCSDITPDYFDHLGLLRNGYALLAHYLLNPDKYENVVYYDKLLYNKDMWSLSSDWYSVDYDDIKNNIANIVVLDIPKKSLGIRNKIEYYSKSNFEDVKNIFSNKTEFSYSQFRKREKQLKDVLMNYFISSHHE